MLPAIWQTYAANHREIRSQADWPRTQGWIIPQFPSDLGLILWVEISGMVEWSNLIAGLWCARCRQALLWDDGFFHFARHYERELI
jgi:hypothetical protein